MKNSAAPIGENGKKQKKNDNKEMKVSYVEQGKIDKFMEYWENYENECGETNKYAFLDVMTFDVPSVSIKDRVGEEQEKVGLSDIQNTVGNSKELINNPNELTLFRLGNIEKEPKKKNAFKKGLKTAKEYGEARRKAANERIEEERKSSEENIR